MGTPEERMKHQRRRQRNFIAKKLREDKRFRPRRIEKRLDDKSWESFMNDFREVFDGEENET
jgi:hypothetical protein